MECDEGDICGKHQMEKGSRAQTVVNQMAQRPIELCLVKCQVARGESFMRDANAENSFPAKTSQLAP